MDGTPWAYENILFPEKGATAVKVITAPVTEEWNSWNTRFQSIIAMPTTTTAEKLTKYTLLHTLNKDFISTATTYARILVSELYLPDEQKSIHLEPLGGLAGGRKYLWRGILFKFANGSQGPYNNNDEYAAKAIGHDLKGANSYFRCNISGLHVALQAVIDYKGHRVHAQAQLPINNSTLVLGSADACDTVHCNHYDLLQKLKFAAQELNLREHTVKDIKLFSACDIEGHIGSDGRAYIVDLARTFPPEDPTVTSHLQCHDFSLHDTVIYRDRSYTITAILNGKYTLSCATHSVSSVPASELASTHTSIFWRLLRPELVKHYGNALLQQLLTERDEEFGAVDTSNVVDSEVIALPIAASTSPYSFANTMTTPAVPTLERNSSNSSVSNNTPMYDASELLVSPTNNSATVLASSHNSYLDAAKKSLPSLRKTLSHPAGNVSAAPTSLRRHTSTPTKPLSILAPRASTPQTRSETLPEFLELPVFSPALSPDAFSRFSQSDPSAATRNREVTAATKFLVHTLIPEMAKNLTLLASTNRLTHLNITEYMHKYGVNIRHLGLLYSHIPVDSDATSSTLPLRQLLLHECILRTLKHMSRDMIRTYMKHGSSNSGNNSSSEAGIHEIWIRILNLVSGAHSNSESFWESVKQGVIKRFGTVAIQSVNSCHSSDSIYPSWSLLQTVEQSKALLLRLCTVSGVRISEQCKQQLNGYKFEFAIADILEIVPVVKHMHQVDLADGILLSLLAQQREKQQHNAIITRLLSLSASRLHRALHTLPNDVTTSLALSDVYQAWGFAAQNDHYFHLSRHYLTAEHTRCSQTSTSYRDDILGIVVVVQHYPRRDNNQNWRRTIRHISFALDVVCYQYFVTNTSAISSDFASATGVTNNVVRFIPLIIDEEHASRALNLLLLELVKAYALEDGEYFPSSPANTSLPTSPRLPSFTPTIGLAVIAAIMNSMVVDFVSVAEEGNLSEGALQGYSRFHHMLLYLSHSSSSDGNSANWVKEADRVVSSFISNPKYRSKKHTPDLGRLLVYLLASGRQWDSDISGVFLAEAFRRQVSWWIPQAAELLLLEKDDICFFRLATTFSVAQKALRIIMFQIYFIQSVAPRMEQNSDWLLFLYNSSLGRPTAAMRGEVEAQFEAILAVENYSDFLTRVQCEMSPAELCRSLRCAVRGSVEYWKDSLKGKYKHVIETWENCESSQGVYTMSWERALADMSRCDINAEKKKRRQQLQTLLRVEKSNTATNEPVRSHGFRSSDASTGSSTTWSRGARPDDKSVNSNNSNRRRYGSGAGNNRSKLNQTATTAKAWDRRSDK